MAADMTPLRFQAWQSAPDVGFWQKLAALKLDKFQLDDRPQRIVGYFAPGRSPTVPARLTVDESAFAAPGDEPTDRARYEWKAHGLLVNTNTLEDFKALDKQALLQKAAEDVVDAVTNKDGSSAEALNAFVVVTFADLKKHSFLYWFGFPALALPDAVVATPPCSVSAALTPELQTESLKQLMNLRKKDTDGAVGVFPAFFVIEKSTTSVRVHEFSAWRNLESTTEDAEILFGFVDPCALPSNPGWPLRNYVVLLSALPASKLRCDAPIKVISFREHVRHLDSTQVPSSEVFEWKSSRLLEIALSSTSKIEDVRSLKVVGWEANVRGKMGPRLMELGSMLDPVRLAEQSVDLNLKLMLWRQLPSLKLDVLSTTKCLVLGAGTLGCYTARNLLAWGFRNITLVDNSVVSHSNPVRQPLFEFKDVGKSKAEAAAESMKRIFPLVNATSCQLSIPMAGHALSNDHLVDEAKSALLKLDELIETHDIVILGTDSRESRWLPTVMCAAKQKVLLNAALGFDSYLVMRHGVGASSTSSLGCYFCNDVVSPRDSLKDRTLDQMCTVTRPGLAPIAAATAVELLVALLHSPDGVHTGADKPHDASVPLGYVPHQIRGFMNSFGSMVVTGEAFDRCIACSRAVLDAFRDDPFSLLQNACNSTTFLEELTGLNKLTEAADAFLDELDIQDSDFDEEEDNSLL